MSVRYRKSPEDVVTNNPPEPTELKPEIPAVALHVLSCLNRLKDLAWAQCETLYVEVRQPGGAGGGVGSRDSGQSHAHLEVAIRDKILHTHCSSYSLPWVAHLELPEASSDNKRVQGSSLVELNILTTCARMCILTGRQPGCLSTRRQRCSFSVARNSELDQMVCVCVYIYIHTHAHTHTRSYLCI